MHLPHEVDERWRRRHRAQRLASGEHLQALTGRPIRKMVEPCDGTAEVALREFVKFIHKRAGRALHQGPRLKQPTQLLHLEWLKVDSAGVRQGEHVLHQSGDEHAMPVRAVGDTEQQQVGPIRWVEREFVDEGQILRAQAVQVVHRDQDTPVRGRQAVQLPPQRSSRLGQAGVHGGQVRHQAGGRRAVNAGGEPFHGSDDKVPPARRVRDRAE